LVIPAIYVALRDADKIIGEAEVRSKEG